MAEKGFNWTEHALARFADLAPEDAEVDAVDDCMKKVLAGNLGTFKIPADRELPGELGFKCGRFGVLFWYRSEDAEIAHIQLWAEWMR